MYNTNPRVDLAFKKIFGSPENSDLLISLINSVVSEEDKVTEVELLNPYNERNFRHDKLSVLDIKATDKRGHRYNIEMQITDEADYDKRALYYWARVYTEQLKEGMHYGDLRKAIGIHVLNFVSILKKKKYHSCFRMQDVEDHSIFFKDIELHTIELAKFSETVDDDLGNIAKRVKNNLDMWAVFLTKYYVLESSNLPKLLNKPEMRKALDVLEHLSFNKAERDEYDAHHKWLMIEANAIEKAEGRGRERGIEQGEANKANKIAKKMKDNLVPLDDIADYTGLDKGDIEKL